VSASPQLRMTRNRLSQRNKVRRFAFLKQRNHIGEKSMNGIIYLVGLIVVVMAVLSLVGLR
jgi:hypothetical protein